MELRFNKLYHTCSVYGRAKCTNWVKWAKNEQKVSQVNQMSHVSQVSNVSKVNQEWDKWAKGDPRMSQGRAKSEPSEPKWAKWAKSEPSEPRMRQEWAKSVKSAKSAEWAKSEPCEPSEPSEPWVNQEWAKWAMRAKWAQSEPRMSQEWAKSVPRVSQVSQYGRPEYSAVRCLLFGANLTDVGILSYICLLFPDGKNILAANLRDRNILLFAVCFSLLIGQTSSIGLLLATPLKVFKHSDISETRKKSLYGVKIPTACSWNTKYASWRGWCAVKIQDIDNLNERLRLCWARKGKLQLI